MRAALPCALCLLVLGFPGASRAAEKRPPQEAPPDQQTPAAGLPAAGETMTRADLAGWILLGTGLAAAAAGAVLGGTALAEKDFAGRGFDSQSAYDDSIRSVENKALAADVLFGVAGAAILGSILAFVVFDAEPAAAPVSLAPPPGASAGGLLVIGGSF